MPQFNVILRTHHFRTYSLDELTDILVEAPSLKKAIDMVQRLYDGDVTTDDGDRYTALDSDIDEDTREVIRDETSDDPCSITGAPNPDPQYAPDLTYKPREKTCPSSKSNSR